MIAAAMNQTSAASAVAPEMAQSGVVELRSGRWEWNLSPAKQGSSVVFWRWSRGRDEMRNWVPTRDLTPEEACEAAKDAVLRSWTDAGGTCWMLTLEPIRVGDLSQEGRQAGDPQEDMYLVFASSWTTIKAPVSGSMKVGELTSDALSRLLENENARRRLHQRQDLAPTSRGCSRRERDGRDQWRV